MAYGLRTNVITDNNWHMVTDRTALVQCSRDYIFRYGSSVAPSNTDNSGIRAQGDYIVSNSQIGVYLYIKRIVTTVPLSITLTGDVV